METRSPYHAPMEEIYYDSLEAMNEARTRGELVEIGSPKQAEPVAALKTDTERIKQLEESFEVLLKEFMTMRLQFKKIANVFTG